MRTFLWIVALPVFALQTYLTFGPGGLVATYSVAEMGRVWLELSWSNPVMAVAFVDFVALQIVTLVWMIGELPRERRWSASSLVWLVTFIVYPGVGALLYFLWLHRDRVSSISTLET